jgi:hypothetical protein
MLAQRALAAVPALLLAACASAPDLTQPVEPIGDFRLGHNVVLATAAQEGPFSRDATEEELAAAVESAMAARLRRYDGDGLYHIGVRIEAFVLGQPGIPIVLSPQSVLLLAVNIWDNETRERLNEEPIRVTAFEALNTRVPLISSGFVNSKEEQLENLAISAAKEIEDLLRENEETWFAPKADRVRVEFTPGAPLTAEQQATAEAAIQAAE